MELQTDSSIAAFQLFNKSFALQEKSDFCLKNYVPEKQTG